MSFAVNGSFVRNNIEEKVLADVGALRVVAGMRLPKPEQIRDEEGYQVTSTRTPTAPLPGIHGSKWSESSFALEPSFS